MKNNCNFQNLEIGRPLWAFAKKIPLVMKLFIICLFCSIGMVQAVESYAQNARISLKVEEETVADVLKEIEEAGTLSPQPNNNWRFVPESWTRPAIKRDREILFDKK